MEANGCSKYVGGVSLLLFLFLVCCTHFGNAQPGFLSINCGGKGNFTDPETNFAWFPDDKFIQNLGEKAESYLKDTRYHFYLGSLRVFPKPLKKVCYELPLTPNVPHLLRLSFVQPYSTVSRGFNYSVETVDMLYMEKVVFSYADGFSSENIFVSADRVVHICLIRTSECDDPFISSIELRPLKSGMYDKAQPGTMLSLIERDDMGGADNITRYPQDKFDRVWYPWGLSGTDSVNVSRPIAVDNTKNSPPSNVMQTAVVGSASDSDGIDLSLGASPTGRAVLLLYFAALNSSETGSFSVRINNVKKSPIAVNKTFSAVEAKLEYNGTKGATLSLGSGNSGPMPFINAIELYSLFSTQPPTSHDDGRALGKLKTAFNLSSWISDPCFGLPWEGIVCRKISGSVRITQIDLSGRQLRGAMPPSFGELTELVSVSLNNNYFSGPLPNLGNLSKLEKLNLQNNYLSGELPSWLSKLPRLKELDISNNNFKGVIPQRLLNRNFTLHFSGNKHLCPTKQKCRHGVTSIAVGVAGGVITMAILVGIAMYRLRFKSPCAQPTPLDYLMVSVANSSKSRAFTLEEMKTATENFNHKIGQGSFGPVFLGELHDGKQIAVKVLSVFSKHGIDQFLNEVDLLSKINHKKLVSFLGYCICNESRDLMLVYDYMSGGSLSDNLYDPEAPKYSQLDWKTRLQIALDAAQGLEYLHVGCTPKIIHRDVKTSNILLDSNLNGRLADFGLSRVTGNGETSQINTTIKGTPGYLDPMYYRTHMLTDKSDVYSFGVVLLELICGRKPIDINVSTEKILLTEWVASYAGAEKDDANIHEMVDKRLDNHYSLKSMTHLVNLAWRCIASEPSSRPSISEVVAEIKEGLTCEEEYYQVPDEVELSLSSFSSSL